MKTRLTALTAALALTALAHAQTDAPPNARPAPSADFEQTPAPRVDLDTPAPETPPANEGAAAKVEEAWAIAQDGSPAQAQGLEQSAVASRGFWQWALRAGSALLLVLGLILACWWLAQRLGARTPLFAGAQLGHVLGQIHLNSRSSLYFVRTGGRVLVVGSAQQGVSLVAEFDAAAFDHIGAPPEAKPDAHSGGQSAPGLRGLGALLGARNAPGGSAPKNVSSFIEQLQARAQGMQQELEASREAAAQLKDEPADGDSPRAPSSQPRRSSSDIDSLREDIERLQSHLRETQRD